MNSKSVTSRDDRLRDWPRGYVIAHIMYSVGQSYF